MVKNVEFYSDGRSLKGNIYYPENFNIESCYPTVVLCHGFAGVKELLLPNFAQKFAHEGFIALTFDYRGFGQSEGDRGVIIPQEQIRDIRNAITYISSLEEVDSQRIALWGTSLGGANALTVAALDKRIKSLSVQITFGNGERNNCSTLTTDEKSKLDIMLNKAWTNSVTKNRTMMLPLKKILSDKQSVQFFDDNIEAFPEALKARIPLTTNLLINEFKPEEYFNKIDIPVLVVGATQDIVNNPDESREIYNGLPGVDKELLMVDATHYDIYCGKNLETVSNAQVKLFKRM